jgi:hypothetical protein
LLEPLSSALLEGLVVKFSFFHLYQVIDFY